VAAADARCRNLFTFQETRKLQSTRQLLDWAYYICDLHTAAAQLNPERDAFSSGSLVQSRCAAMPQPAATCATLHKAPKAPHAYSTWSCCVTYPAHVAFQLAQQFLMLLQTVFF
jgi:hypothetical protein